MTDTSPSPRGLRVTRAQLLPALVGFLAGIVVLFGVLTMWNGALPIPIPSPTPTPTLTPLPLPDDAWASVTDATQTVAVTAPGTTVQLGTAAQVEIATGGESRALISVTADAPTLAPAADFAVIRQAVPQLAGMNVYYVRVAVSKVSGDPLAGVDLTTVFTGVTADRQIVQRLTLVDWRKCAGGVLPAEIDTAGTTANLCLAVAVPVNGLTPAGVLFSQSGGPYDVSRNTAVTWLN